MFKGNSGIGKFLSGIFGSTGDAPATLPTTTAPASVVSILKSFVNVFVAFTNSPAGTLTAPDQEAVVALGARYLKNHVFTFDVATIDTSVEVGIFGKASGETVRSQAGQNNAVITADGRFMVKVSSTPLSEVSLKLVAETGGTAVEISNITYRGQN